ncbi:MAG: PilZ domain-containing protein [Pseudomonadota bacterium]
MAGGRMEIRERRSARRFPSHLGIVTVDKEGMNFGFITDLSRYGAYIESQNVLPIGTPFQFTLSNGTVSAPVVGRVVRMRDNFFHGGKSGFGIRFERMEGVAKSLRDDILLSLMAERFHALWTPP